MTTLVLIAKETLPGKVKTRLTPALTPEQAAELAAACIGDTLAATATLPATRRILAFDGTRVPAGAETFEVLHQVGGTLDQRLGAIFDEVDGPLVLIGMDTPQLDHDDLAPAFDSWPEGVDAWFGPATDGGFWALGMNALSVDQLRGTTRGDLIRGVPMSQDDTGRRQLERLVNAGLNVTMLPELTDVDTIADAHEVAEIAPHGSFAATLAGFRQLTAAGPARFSR
ncbi:hypothetical protein B0I08_107203 [Glaciihabitans tibetensis]|uniref:Glycosyltransferase A (GT-A) superfamily protein (DUF2064 family) n=1 Tax=Glaciihabitans tibetensis TaxID=1266600 RepID=A0A2T0VB62_9MICO|nr:DUF2064 domain-containing protein [Glaciihabitans tibetensis]PRY67307.1 hypothetical protein B0I08_107203 [Glaciihabitans tibetensis]